MGCKYRVMDKCRAKDNLKDDFCFGKDSCPYYEDEVKVTSEDQYEARLKADFVAMLTELQLEIEELDVSDVVPEYQDGAEETKEYIANMIQEKIDSLKENMG